MLILGLLSLLFWIVYCSENRLKINITPYGEIFYYLTYRNKFKLWKVTFSKKNYHWEIMR